MTFTSKKQPPEWFCKKGCSYKFRKTHRKTPAAESLFWRPKTCNFIKKDALPQVFSCDFAKFLRKPFLQNTSGWLLLTSCITYSLQYSFLMEMYRKKDVLKNITELAGVSLWILWNFWGHFFYRTPPEDCWCRYGKYIK